MSKLGKFIAACAAVMGGVTSLFAVEQVLPGSGDDAAAITAAIAATAGEGGDGVVQLAPGTYVLTAQVTVDKPVTVKGVGRLLTRIVSDGTTHRLFYLNDADAVLSDVTLAGATAGGGGAGVYINAGTLQDAVVRDCTNTSGYSGGVYVMNGAVRRCILTGNKSNGGGGGGGVYANGNVVVENTLAYGNAAAWGGAIYVESGSRAAVVNCTFADNTAWTNGPDTYDYSGSGALYATNTIFGVLVKNNNVKNSIYTRCYSTTDANPLYVAAGGGNYRLSSESPLLGVGVAVDCTRDVEGNPFSVTPSIGAFQQATSAVFELSGNVLFVGDALDVTVHYPDACAEGEGTLSVFAHDGSAATYAVADGSTQTISLSVLGAYSLALRVTSGDESVSADFYNAALAGIGNVYVDSQSSNPITPYLTPEAAARTIEDALPFVMDGGTVWICDGIHEMSSVLTLNRAVTIKGLNGREKAIILQTGANRLFSLDFPTAKLSGLTLRGSGKADSLAGLGVHIAAGGGLVEDCLFENFNGAGSGAAAFAELGEGTFERCIFRNNKAAKYAGGAYASTKGRINLRNCLFYGNTGGGNWGSAVYVDGPGTMVNCTLYNNTVTPIANGELCRCHADFAVTNCIFGSVSWYTGSSNHANNLGGSTSLADPGFRDAANSDYRLSGTATSAIDQGEDSAVAEGETDLAGARRIQGEHVDLGCYEYSAEEFSAGFSIVGSATVVGESVRLVPAVTGGQNPVNSWRAVNMASGTTIVGETSGSGDEAGFEVTFTEPGVWSFYYSVTDGDNAAESSALKAVTIPVTGDIYVAASGSPVAPFGTPATATTNLWVAAKIVPDGATIHVLPGVHLVYERVDIARGVQLVGAGTERTVLTCPKNSLRGILSVGHASSVVRDVTLTGSFGALYTDGLGGGIRLTAGLVTGCLFTNIVQNAIVSGGALEVTGAKSRVSRCLFRGCSTQLFGGAIHAQDNAVVDNCLITDSRSGEGYNQYGGLLYVDSYSPCMITNCTFSGSVERGIYLYNQVSKLVNCVFDCAIYPASGAIQTNVFFSCASSPSAAAGSENSHAIPDVNWAANGNQNEVELGLVDAANGDYHLTRRSPCRRAGIYQPWMRREVDLEGRRRTAGNTVDLGCYQDSINGLTIFVR